MGYFNKLKNLFQIIINKFNHSHFKIKQLRTEKNRMKNKKGSILASTNGIAYV